jgi:hypothetical protein
MTVDSTLPTSGPSTRAPSAATDTEASPFVITYQTSDSREPTPEEFDQAQAVTLQYLEDFLVGEYEFNLITALNDVLGLALSESTDPLAVAYATTLLFSPESGFIPSQEDIDVQVFTAFQEQAVFDLVAALQGLPPENPFSSTTSVQFTSFAIEVVQVSETSSGSTVAFGALIGMILFIFGLLASRVVYRKPSYISVDNDIPHRVIIPGQSNIMAFMDCESEASSRRTSAN